MHTNRSTRNRITVATAVTALVAALSPALASAALAPVDEFGGYPAPYSDEYGMPTEGYGPAQTVWGKASRYDHKNPGRTPEGANNFNCKPKVKGALPIVLVPGTGESAYATWAYYAPELTRRGYCVYTFNYGPALATVGNKFAQASLPFEGDLHASAKALGKFVNMVLKRTGAPKVDFIGHSQGGGVLPNAYIKWYGGNKTVRHTVGLVASNFGTNLSLGSIPVVDPTTGTMLAFIPNPLPLASSNYGSGKGLSDVIDTIPGGRDLMVKVMNAANITSSEQQTKNSEFLKKYSSTPITMPGVKYTVITTRFDDVVTPYRNAFIFEPGVTNVVVQDYCANDHSDHFTFSYDPNALEIAVNALQGNANKPIKCRAKAFGI